MSEKFYRDVSLRRKAFSSFLASIFFLIFAAMIIFLSFNGGISAGPFEFLWWTLLVLESVGFLFISFVFYQDGKTFLMFGGKRYLLINDDIIAFNNPADKYNQKPKSFSLRLNDIMKIYALPCIIGSDSPDLTYEIWLKSKKGDEYILPPLVLNDASVNIDAINFLKRKGFSVELSDRRMT